MTGQVYLFRRKVDCERKLQCANGDPNRDSVRLKSVRSNGVYSRQIDRETEDFGDEYCLDSISCTNENRIVNNHQELRRNLEIDCREIAVERINSPS